MTLKYGIKKIVFAFVMITVLMLSICTSAFAAEAVYDEAGLFSDADIVEIKNDSQSLAQLTGWDVYVVTTGDAQGKTVEAYADDYYDNLGGAENGILYLVDMDNGELYISTSGEAMDYITYDRIQLIFDDVMDYAYDGNFGECVTQQIGLTESYYNMGTPEENSKADTMMFFGFVGAVVGVAAALIGVFSVKKSYAFKKAEDVYEYTSKSDMKLSVNSDRLVNSFVTTRIRPRPKNNGGGPSSSGGSHVHTSSSGRTHGGGGRSFR